MTVLNSQEFAIFKTPRFFEFGQLFIANVHDLQLFCKFLSSTQGLKKWTLEELIQSQPGLFSRLYLCMQRERERKKAPKPLMNLKSIWQIKFKCIGVIPIRLAHHSEFTLHQVCTKN